MQCLGLWQDAALSSYEVRARQLNEAVADYENQPTEVSEAHGRDNDPPSPIRARPVSAGVARAANNADLSRLSDGAQLKLHCRVIVWTISIP